MKKFLIPSVLLLIVGAMSTGCCHSLVCSAKKAASQNIQCKESMKIKNMTSEIKKSPDSNERYIQVEGCGRHVTLVCHPTNERKKIKKKYREDLVVPQNRLELKWKCKEAGQLTLKKKAIPGSINVLKDSKTSLYLKIKAANLSLAKELFRFIEKNTPLRSFRRFCKPEGLLPCYWHHLGKIACKEWQTLPCKS